MPLGWTSQAVSQFESRIAKVIIMITRESFGDRSRSLSGIGGRVFALQKVCFLSLCVGEVLTGVSA